MRQLVIALGAAACLSACVTYPKPEYRYTAQAGDPEFSLTSDFGVDSEFRVQTDPGNGQSYTPAERVAYMQAMDSYTRDASAKGPWKFSTPVDLRVVISGRWFKYGSSSTMGNMKTIYASTACTWQSKSFMPVQGGRYQVHLRDAGRKGCELEITAADGSPVSTAN